MRIGTVAASRPAYYDRNPTTVVLHFLASGVAPHTDTIRATYTVPAGKKAWIDCIMLNIRRETAPTSAGLAGLYAEFRTATNAVAHILQNLEFTATANIPRDLTETQFGLLQAGETLRLVSFDLSTGGTYAYHCDAKIVEFDA